MVDTKVPTIVFYLTVFRNQSSNNCKLRSWLQNSTISVRASWALTSKASVTADTISSTSAPRSRQSQIILLTSFSNIISFRPRAVRPTGIATISSITFRTIYSPHNFILHLRIVGQDHHDTAGPAGIVRRLDLHTCSGTQHRNPDCKSNSSNKQISIFHIVLIEHPDGGNCFV